ncbi:hypothetical protein K1719_046425 [Acacia pycnantha]|nr:hypothetical protein K1719_046425 [Acacia pycnantha]
MLRGDLFVENVKLKSSMKKREGEEGARAAGMEQELSEMKRVKKQLSIEIVQMKKKLKRMMATLVFCWLFFLVVLSK